MNLKLTLPKMAVRLGRWAVACLLLWGSCAHAQQLDKDVGESIVKVAAKTKDQYNNTVEGELQVTTFKPPGIGPFPLVVVSHGRAGSAEMRRAFKRPRYSQVSRFFVRKGFVVAVPLRFGYGDQTQGDPEEGGDCARTRHDVSFGSAADQIIAVTNYMQQLPYVDKTKLVLVGHSVGGFSTLAAAAANPPGLIATVNFAGGKGGQPDKTPGEPCGSSQIARLAAKYASSSVAKQSLWLYNENDSYFNFAHASAWHKAFNSEGGQARLLKLPPQGKDGHDFMMLGSDQWQPILDKYFAELGFDRPGVVETPEPTGFAALEDAAALPITASADKVRTDYDRYLRLPEPKAFAIGGIGTWGMGIGDDSLSKALAACQRDVGAPCKLYAVNGKVVWPK